MWTEDLVHMYSNIFDLIMKRFLAIRLALEDKNLNTNIEIKTRGNEVLIDRWMLGKRARRNKILLSEGMNGIQNTGMYIRSYGYSWI